MKSVRANIYPQRHVCECAHMPARNSERREWQGGGGGLKLGHCSRDRAPQAAGRGEPQANGPIGYTPFPLSLSSFSLSVPLSVCLSLPRSLPRSLAPPPLPSLSSDSFTHSPTRAHTVSYTSTPQVLGRSGLSNDLGFVVYKGASVMSQTSVTNGSCLHRRVVVCCMAEDGISAVRRKQM